jgi:hypothetical protein
MRGACDLAWCLVEAHHSCGPGGLDWLAPRCTGQKKARERRIVRYIDGACLTSPTLAQRSCVCLLGTGLQHHSIMMQLFELQKGYHGMTRMEKYPMPKLSGLTNLI